MRGTASIESVVTLLTLLKEENLLRSVHYWYWEFCHLKLQTFHNKTVINIDSLTVTWRIISMTHEQSFFSWSENKLPDQGLASVILQAKWAPTRKSPAETT